MFLLFCLDLAIGYNVKSFDHCKKAFKTTLRTVQHEVRDPNLGRLVPWYQDAEGNSLIKSGDPGRWHGMVWGPLVHYGMAWHGMDARQPPD